MNYCEGQTFIEGTEPAKAKRTRKKREPGCVIGCVHEPSVEGCREQYTPVITSEDGCMNEADVRRLIKERGISEPIVIMTIGKTLKAEQVTKTVIR